MTATFAVRLDFGRVLLDDGAAAPHVAEILSRPCFAELGRISGRFKDRWAKYARPTPERIEQYLSDPSFDAVYFDSRKTKELVASAEIEIGLRGGTPRSPSTGLLGYLAIPIDDTAVDAVLHGVCELATVLQAGAGCISVEPEYSMAHRVALGGSRPKARAGLSDLRRRGRRARAWKSELLASQLATVEWGTFLGAGHLARIDLPALRRAGVFSRVVECSPTLVFLQLTADPHDDLSGLLESKLPSAREALAPVMMDITDVTLEG